MYSSYTQPEQTPGFPASVITVIPGHAGYIVIALGIALAFALYRYLRLRYPCISLSELQDVKEALGNSIRASIQNGYLDEQEQEEIEFKKLGLDIRALEISALPFSILLKTCLGIEVELVRDIVGWYNDAEKLRRDIQANVSVRMRAQRNAGQLGNTSTTDTTTTNANDHSQSATSHDDVSQDITDALASLV